MSTVVAIVPAKDRQDSVAATVGALRSLADVRRVLVVDDGSTDGTAEAARRAGAAVLRLHRNHGKGDAVLAGVAAEPDADVYLLIDADLAETAAVADALLAPVLDDRADMTVAVLPPAAGRGGFGLVRRLAGRGIERAGGPTTRAPLSGQRAVRAPILQRLTGAPRFGLEVALTVDAARAGARILEVEAPMEHRHTGRSWRGFAHRARQGGDIVAALWPRLLGGRRRLVGLLAVTALALVALVVMSGRAQPVGVAQTTRPRKVLLFGIPRFSIDDLAAGRMPNLSRLARTGAVSVNSTRSMSSTPAPTETYATIGAGVRVTPDSSAADARMADDPVEGSTARQVVDRRTGRTATGEVVVVGGPKAIAGTPSDVGSAPGAFGQALDRAGRRVAVINNGDTVDELGNTQVSRPAAVAVMNKAASVDLGDVSGSVGDGSLDIELLQRDPAAPFGIRANPGAVVAKTERALQQADVVLVDPGDTDRAGQYAPSTSGGEAEALRRTALRHTDDILGRLADHLPRGTLLLVVGVSPPADGWGLTPVVAYGAGVRHGYLYSPSTRRTGLTTTTDLAPTVLHDLGVPVPAGMVGSPLQYQPGTVDLGHLQALDAAATSREDVYGGMTNTFIVLMAVVYLALLVLVLQRRERSRTARLLRLAVLATAAWPLATFLLRALPTSVGQGAASQVAVWVLAVALALVADRWRTGPLAPLTRICGLTVVVVLVDLALGADLQQLTVLGYSPHAAARYTGIGNMAFGALAGAAAVWALIRVDRVDPRDRAGRDQALLVAAAIFVLVVVADGWPTLGSDVGGVLTLVPVYGLAWFVASGRKVRWRIVLLLGAATAVVLGGVTILDLLRPADQRSHLGRFAAGIFDGSGEAWTTISRKASTNLRVLQNTDWAFIVPVVAVFAYGVLGVRDGVRRLLPKGSARRTAAVAATAVGVLGGLVNDSGVVVTALALVYVGPLVALAALDDGDPVPDQLEPTADDLPELELEAEELSSAALTD